MKQTLEDIKILIDALAQQIAAPQDLLPTYGRTIDGAHPHIEIDNSGQLYYVIVERGKELLRELALNTDDLLYKTFADITFSMSVKYELRHRIANEDSRRQRFAKQEELLGVLNDDWKPRIEQKHQLILKSHPFDDQAMTRAIYSKQLRDNGMPAGQAWTEACRKYPEPITS